MKEYKHPYIFVSYSWDSDDHKEKVKNFVQNLRLDNINVTYDGDLQFGERLPHYMEESIRNSDIVLFICTPNYKYRADNRISGVGAENQIITGELYETCNEKKFIPILFSGTWEASLPTWAKGKLGADLSTHEFYDTNYQKLVQHLKNIFPNAIVVETTERNIKEKVSSSQTNEGICSFISAVKVLWKKISDVTTFRGLVLVAVVAGVILLYISPFFSAPHTPEQDNPSSSNTIASGEKTESSVSDDKSIEDANINDASLNSNVLDNPVTSKNSYDEDAIKAQILEDLTAFLDTNPTNGTMPKGTVPITVVLPDDLEEKLTFIQKLSIGGSKKWIDDKLGPPYAETVMGIKDDRLIRPDEDENSKTGEILVCAYNIYDIIMVQACFDISDNSCLAFFVTLLDDILGVDIMMPTYYSSLVSDKSLGEFAFSELGEYITATYGYAGQGIGRAFYGEEYYFGAAGNYKTFYFAVLDYGMLNSRTDFSRFLSVIQFSVGPGDNTLPLPEVLNSEREKFYPNTYGISTFNTQLTFELLSSYYWFDNLPLSNWSY